MFRGLLYYLITALLIIVFSGCVEVETEVNTTASVPEVDFELSSDQTHNRWSSAIEPVLTVPSGSVIKVGTEEASDQQLDVNSTLEDLANLSFDPIHPLTGPVYVENAEPGDVLKLKWEIGGGPLLFPGLDFSRMNLQSLI